MNIMCFRGLIISFFLNRVPALLRILFHIRSTIVDADDPAQESTRIIDYLPKKISEMITFFKWIVPEMTSLEQSTLLECITEAYAKFGLMLHEDIVDLPDTFSYFKYIGCNHAENTGNGEGKGYIKTFCEWCIFRNLQRTNKLDFEC
ncbi:hypothetical protein GCM10020331_012630 [Ectobacillus funiculus]